MHAFVRCGLHLGSRRSSFSTSSPGDGDPAHNIVTVLAVGRREPVAPGPAASTTTVNLTCSHDADGVTPYVEDVQVVAIPANGVRRVGGSPRQP